MNEDGKLSLNKSTHPLALVSISILLFLGSQFLAAMLIYPLAEKMPSQNYKLVLYNITGMLVLFFLLMLTRSRESFWKRTGLLKTKFKNYLIVIPIFMAYIAFSICLTLIMSAIFKSFDINQVQDIGFSTSLASWEMIVPFISLVIITPIFEEIIFRGVLFRGLRRRWSFWLSAVVVSLLFAIAHGQWNVAIDTFALSIALCYLADKSGSILPSIVLHSLKNSIAFLLLFVIN